MKLLKRLAAAALALSLLASLTACGGKGITEKDAETYIKGELDALYMGTYNKDYLDLVEDLTESEAKENHEDNVAAEAEFLLYDFLGVEIEDDSLEQRAQAFIKELYSHAKYTVGAASKTKEGDFVIEVTVSPIEIMNLFTEDIFYNAIDASGYLEAESSEEIDAAELKLGNLILDELESFLSQLSYGKEQSIMFHLKPNDEGYYTLMEAGLQSFDNCIIDYSGDYME